jgi:regulator of protease activity HflC (stomatin/prohibitin superfamily)
MKGDYLAYGRASSVGLFGMVTQGVLGLALLLYAILGSDGVALSSAYLVLLGCGVWLSLAVVFDQHRRERVEDMEARSLAAAGRTASVFQAAEDELRVNARRLAWMHRWLLPGVSVALGLALVSLGLVRLNGARANLNIDTFEMPAHKGWALAIGIAVGVVGFVFARFVSGMAKQPVWRNLRGGAGAIVGAAIVGLALAVGHFAETAGSKAVLMYLQVAVPGLMIVLGAEVFLNLLLNLYRPRKTGEVPRPPFDSGLLSFVASPDRIAESIGGAINYQFGVEVTSSWAYRLLSRSVLALVLVGAAAVWALTCLEVVEANERGIRIRLGAKVGEVGPGLYVKAPWPFEVIETQQTTAVGPIDLMTPSPKGNGPILWTNEHQVEEVYAIVKPTTLRLVGDAAAADLADGSTGQADATRDVALIAVEVPLAYTVTDLLAFEEFAAVGERGEYIRAIARREAQVLLADYTEDEVIGSRRNEIGAELARRVQARLDGLKAGVRVLHTALEGVHPPQKEDAAKAFEKIIENQQRGLGAVEQGETRAIEILTQTVGSVELARQITAEIAKRDELQTGGADAAALKAQEEKIATLIGRSGGKVGAMLAEARSRRWAAHMSARGRADAYKGQLAAFEAAPASYKAGLYFQMLRDVMANARVYITTDDANNDLRMHVDVKDIDTGANALTNPQPQ